MSAKNKWLIGLGILAGLAVLFFLPSIWQVLFPAAGCGYEAWGGMPHMRGGFGRGFSPMYGGMGFGTFFMWLVPAGLLALVGLAIAALVKYLKTPPPQ
jgi:hypothetical protein